MIEVPHVVDVSAQATAVIHMVVPAAEIRQVMGPGISEVVAAVAAQGLPHAGAWFTHHFRPPAEVFDFEVGIPVVGTIAPTGRVRPARLPAARVARTRMPTLRRVGLSERKALYLRDLARHFVGRALDPAEWPALDDETLIARLVDVDGIGRWTAEMFLIFHELRPNVLPVADIGLVKAVALHYHDGERMTPADLLAFGERWAPWRSVATWYLWRSLDPIPVEY